MKNSENIIRELLALRGIRSEGEIHEYLTAKPKKTYDPFLMLGMREAVDTICQCIENGDKICVYGDYDCDGVTSVCLLTSVLEEVMPKEDVSYYIPSRFTEGYGLNKGAVKKIKNSGTSLIITVDCGSVSYEEVEYAKNIGLKVIVTDHHNVNDKKADCILLNPKQEECKYPFDGLCGCGVAYKLAQGLQRRLGFDRGIIIRLLDLVGIATIGDIVPLVDENRTITKYGLNEIRQGRRQSLRILEEEISLHHEKVSSSNIAFGIVPNINACGRMKDAGIAVSMIKGSDDSDLRAKVQDVVYLNRLRKNMQEEAFEKCLEILDGEPKADFTVVKADVHEGIAGIVAGKLKDKLNRPCVLLTESDGKLKGTGRSISGVNIYELIKKQEDFLLRFGGHKGACGFLMEKENFQEFKEALQKDAYGLRIENQGIFEKEVSYDMELKLSDVSLDLADSIAEMEPFGEGNPEPSFLFRDVYIYPNMRMGREKQHIKFIASKDGKYVDCINFGDGAIIWERFFNQSSMNYDENYMKVDLVGPLVINQFNGNRSAQIVINDIDAIIDKKRNS